MLLTLLLGVAVWAAVRSPDWRGYAAAAALLIAVLLMFPPMWRGQTRSRLRLFRYGAVALFAIVGICMPIKIQTVKLDMPNSAARP